MEKYEVQVTLVVSCDPETMKEKMYAEGSLSDEDMDMADQDLIMTVLDDQLDVAFNEDLFIDVAETMKVKPLGVTL